MHLARTFAAVFAAGALTLTGCAGDDLADDSASDPETSAAADKGSLTLAGQNFPEATLVASMYEQLLEDAGYTVETKLVDSRDAYMPTFPGDVDIVPEYVGGIVNFLNTQANGAEAKPFEAGDGEQLASDGASLLEEAGIELLDLSPATDANAFFVTQEFSEAEGVTTLSDLEGQSVTLAAAPDCEGRLDCEGGLSDEYGIDVTEVLPLGYASDQTYQSVLDGESELGETSTTDGTLESQGLVILEDDKQIQPAQNLVPAVSADFLADNPDVADILNPLMAALTTEGLTELNGRMAVDRETAEDVAADFLSRAGPALTRLTVSCFRRSPRSWRGPCRLLADVSASKRQHPRWSGDSHTSCGRSPSAAGSTVATSSTRCGTSSRHAPLATSCTRSAGPSRPATQVISSAASERRSCSTSQPQSRCTGGSPLCTSERCPQISSTPARSSRHHSSLAPGISRK